MSGSWSDSEYISSYSFILARGIRSICMITPEMLLPITRACRSRRRVQIDVQLQVPMTSWHCWLPFIYIWVNALIFIYTVTHTHMCKRACIQVSVIFSILILMIEGQQHMKATWDRWLTFQGLVVPVPGMASTSTASRRGWMHFASSRSCLFFFFLSSLLVTSNK